MKSSDAVTVVVSRRQACRHALGALAGISALAVLANSPARAALSEQDHSDIARIEAYFDGIKTMAAKFQQTEDGKISRGRIFVHRPGRLRVEYDPPVPILVVADGTLLSYVDNELEQVSQMPLRQSTAWFLLRAPMRIEKGVTVTEVNRSPSHLRISMYQTDEPNSGSLELIFKDHPIELQQWKVVDANNRETNVGIYDVELGMDLPAKLFQTPYLRPNDERK
ncbi:MAG: LolA family protein [Dongiaceae bacterium]